MFSSQTQDLLNVCNTTNIEGQRNRLNQRIAQLKEEIQALEGCYNSLSWPSRIPPEILCKIFLLVQSHSKRNDEGEEDLRWIRVTHVCRYWRTTALDCLALWSNLSFVNPKFTEVMLERSKDAPLSIECGWKGQARFQDVLHKAFSRTKQLRSVSITSLGQADRLDLAELLPVLSGPAPLLEDVRLFVMGDDAAAVLPSRFLDKTAPNLKSVRLYNISVGDWNNLPLRSTLTRLHLENHIDARSNINPPRNSAEPSWTQLVAALQDMSVLEDLSLNGFLPTNQLDALIAPRYGSSVVATLGKLRVLKLSSFGSAIEHFITLFRFPNATEVTIGFKGAQDESRIGHILQQLAHSWGGRCNEPAVRLNYIESRRSPLLAFNFRSKEPDCRCPILHVSFDSPTQLSSDDLVMAFRQHMNFSQLATFHLSSVDTLLTKDAWIGVFGALTSLKGIKFDMGCPEAFLQALEDYLPPSPTSDERSPGLAFPSLQSLDFVFLHNRAVPRLVEALRSRPPSSPKLEVNLLTPSDLGKGVFRQIVDALPHIQVNRLWKPENWGFISNWEEEEDLNEGVEIIDVGESDEE